LERLITRGQRAGDIRADLPRDWLVTTYYALLHAADDDVSAGRLKYATAGEIVAKTITSALAPTVRN
jgi:TetR/AcrR family transcriptional repressor of mexCD-oprJ operon